MHFDNNLALYRAYEQALFDVPGIMSSLFFLFAAVFTDHKVSFPVSHVQSARSFLFQTCRRGTFIN